MAYVGCIAGAIPIEDYRQGLVEAGFSNVEVTDSGEDLNPYAKVENQAGCCSPAMNETSTPVAIVAATSSREIGYEMRGHSETVEDDGGQDMLILSQPKRYPRRPLGPINTGLYRLVRPGASFTGLKIRWPKGRAGSIPPGASPNSLLQTTPST